MNKWLRDFSSFVEVGDPRYTAFDINDRGNRIYLKYEPSQPTIFPTRETRFYKPKLHLKADVTRPKERLFVPISILSGLIHICKI